MAGLNPPPVVATIGVFDGIHRGHRALLSMVLERAEMQDAVPLAITFDPHPVDILAPGRGPHRITGTRTKLRLLAELGVSTTWVLPFSMELASLEPEEFIQGLLLREMNLREIWVGYDFRFGRNRAGDIGLLKRLGRRFGFEAYSFGPVHEGGRVLSSTWAREALQAGRIEEAEGVLGHPVLLEGVVERGRGEGSRLVVPTANLRVPQRQILPSYGVYAAWADFGAGLRHAVVNIGVRPTLTSDTRPTVEAHLIDQDIQLRGRRVTLLFATKIREEARFQEVSDLRQAVRRDIEAAREILAPRTPRCEPAPEKSTDGSGTNH